MTKKEIVQLLATLKSHYPKAFPDTSSEATVATIEAWYRVLRDIGYDVASAALESYIADNKYNQVPTIADICYQLRLIAADYEFLASAACRKGDKNAVVRYLTLASAVRNYHMPYGEAI